MTIKEILLTEADDMSAELIQDKKSKNYYIYNALTRKKITKVPLKNLKDLSVYAHNYLYRSKWFKTFPKNEQNLILNSFIRRITRGLSSKEWK